MAYLKHFGGQDYIVIDGKKTFGPMSKSEAEEMVKDIESQHEPLSYEDGLAAFAELRKKLRGESFKDYFYENKLSALKDFVKDPYQSIDNVSDIKEYFIHKCVSDPNFFLRLIRGVIQHHRNSLPGDDRSKIEFARQIWSYRITLGCCNDEDRIKAAKYYIKKYSV